MSRIFKGSVQPDSGKKVIFAIKPYLENFDSFKEEIFIRMPELKNKSLKIFYEDSDGDQITIFNNLDFLIFHEQKINKVFVVEDGISDFVPIQVPPPGLGFSPVLPMINHVPEIASAPVRPKISATIIATPTGAQKKAVPPSSSADDLRRLIHKNIICDNCDKEIRGYRYKCLECNDFDLCMECEPTNHKHHLLLRITNPNDAEICYRAKLGKRFGRHRRSESLCVKPEDRHDKKCHDKKGHHKRHASGARPTSFAEVISDILKTVVNPTDVQAGTALPNEASQAKPTVEKNGGQEKSSPTTTPLNTPSQEPMFVPGFSFGRCDNQRGVHFKNSIDTLSNMAQNFAAMMDPFATYVAESAKATADAVAAASAESTSTNAPKADQIIEPMECVHSEQDKPAEAQSSEPAVVMIVDCSDDEGNDDLLKRASREGSSDSSQVNKSVSAEKDAVDRSDWAFISATEIDDTAQASSSPKSTGAIPKRPTPPLQDASASGNENLKGSPLNYSELSRRLIDHIVTEKKTEMLTEKMAELQAGLKEKDLEAAHASANRMGEYLKASGAIEVDAPAAPIATPTAPTRETDPRIAQAVNTMVAMGFSNEGGWLNQLLEAVNGDITSAIDLMTPHK